MKHLGNLRLIMILMAALGLAIGFAKVAPTLAQVPAAAQTVNTLESAEPGAAAAPAATTFASGSLIIPMDTDTSGNHTSYNQNSGMWKAYGLVYRLLQNNIPVHWAIKENKVYNDIDFTVSSVKDKRTNTALSSWSYRGGPFVIDSANAAAALPIITAWWAANSNQPNVHEALASFSADVNIILRSPPRIANEEINASISLAYYNAAGIPDSTGAVWTSSSPDVLNETEIANGGLFQPGICLERKYDTFVTPHNTGYASSLTDPTNLGTRTYAQLDTFVHQGGGWTALCHSISSNDTWIANLTKNGSPAVKALFKTSLPGGLPGGFLTTNGFPFGGPGDPYNTGDGAPNGGGTWTMIPASASLPVAQAVVTTGATQVLPGGSVQTWPIAGTYAPTYWPSQTERVAAFIQSPPNTVTAKAHSGTTATLTIGTHSFAVGDTIVVALNPPDPVFDGTFTVLSKVNNVSVSYTNASATVPSTPSGGTVSSPDNDQIINGVYHDGTGFGKLTYIGGHSHSTSVPYSTNADAPYLRMFYNSLFFNGNAVAKLDVVYNPEQIPQYLAPVLEVSLKNTGASTATGVNNVSITLAAGFTYQASTFGPVPVVSGGGTVLTWATLPDVPGNTIAATVLINVDASVVATEGFKSFGTIHSQYGDVFGESFTVDVCRDIEVRNIPDRGDLPASYGTLIANNGPSNSYTPAGLILGAYFDYDVEGKPSVNADGDDLVGIPNDEDGVIVTELYSSGGSGPGTAQVTVAGGPGCLNAWMDFTGDNSAVLSGPDGNFTKTGGYDIYQTYSEHIIQNQMVSTGMNNVPFTAAPGLIGAGYNSFYFRFRLSPYPCATITPTGAVSGGEVEDYKFTFSPLGVTLVNFGAMCAAGQPEINWETASELNTLGFNVWRNTSDSGPQDKLNDTMIPAHPGSAQGYTYSFLDTTAVVNTTYYYWLEDIDTGNASTFHGPIEALCQSPTSVGLDTVDANPAAGLPPAALPAAGLLALGAVGATAAWLRRRRA